LQYQVIVVEFLQLFLKTYIAKNAEGTILEKMNVFSIAKKYLNMLNGRFQELKAFI